MVNYLTYFWAPFAVIPFFPLIVKNKLHYHLTFPHQSGTNDGERSINASSHSGRRKFITDLSEKGVSVRVIQELARHRDLATTQRYIDVSVDKLRNAVNLVGI